MTPAAKRWLKKLLRTEDNVPDRPSRRVERELMDLGVFTQSESMRHGSEYERWTWFQRPKDRQRAQKLIDVEEKK